ncbi:MAG: hypothetical protein FJY11_00460 [Bacteroidetes bacterium]|nr:hypothetical protein [Bacteroidota bacterium]
MEPVSILVGLGLLIVFILYVTAVLDVIKNRNRFVTLQTQGLWLMVIVLLPFVGSIVYLLLRERSFTK